MFVITNLCILCLNTYKNLKTVLIEDKEEIEIQKKVKYCLPEIIHDHLEIPNYICNECMNKIDCFYKFKQSCLQNNIYLRKYMQILTSSDETHKDFTMRLIDMINQNKVQAEEKDQALPIVGNDDIRKEADDSEIEIKEHPLLHEKIDIIVKNECDTSDIEFYPIFVKCESIVSDSDNADGHEHSTNSSNGNKNIANNLKENIIKKTNIYQCAVCNKVYQHKHALDNHLKEHADITDLSCSLCNTKFIRKYDLNRHKEIHRDTNFECAICKKTFKVERYLNAHEKCHTGVKNFECSTCKKKFLRRSDLNIHEQIHLGIKNFKCKICNRKFTTKAHLTDHEKSHAAIKNYQCTICDKKYTRKYYLTQHEIIHKSIRNFECTICKKKYTYRRDLIKHVKVHSGIQIYECSVCKKNFSVKRSLISHEKTHIRNENEIVAS